MRISDWSSDVCSSDLGGTAQGRPRARESGWRRRSCQVRTDRLSRRAGTFRPDCVGRHVRTCGPPQYPEFFRHCPNFLNEDGVILPHTIGRLNEPRVTDAWTRTYILPGGYCPSLSGITAARATKQPSEYDWGV